MENPLCIQIEFQLCQYCNVTLYPIEMPAVYSVGIPALVLASDFESQILNLEILDFQLAFIS